MEQADGPDTQELYEAETRAHSERAKESAPRAESRPSAEPPAENDRDQPAHRPERRPDREPRAERRPEPEHRVDPSETLATPVAAPAVPVVPAAAFHAVSEHDANEGESSGHRPMRRRRPGSEAAQQPSALELVETQAPAAPAVAELENELPRRTRPRRRRSGAATNEPLILVETEAGKDSSHQDTPPTP